MGNSPFRPTLYRRRWRAVICASVLLLGVSTYGQFARKNTVSKGPRAVGLVVMPPKGKAHLIPIAIMVDGRFYDASAYKADPVPMALDPGTVYEVERTGESQGLFTINLPMQQKNNWLAEGTYHANGEQVASTGHKAESNPREAADKGPPKLHRPGEAAAKPATSPAESKPANPAPSTPSVPENAKAAPPPKPEPEPEDPNIPKLRRGVPERENSEAETTPAAPSKAPVGAKGAAPGKGATPAPQATAVQTMPAVSDADGPEPRPYTYAMSPAEELGFRNKMLAMAADELRKQVKEFQPEKTEGTASSRHRAAGRVSRKKPAEPTFEDVQLRVFDVSSSNEPVVVLTATAHPPQQGEGEHKFADYYLTLVARSDIYGELRKLLSDVTDSEHLDVQPRLELIDAVDADGDGRGELLFRQISDAGSSYSIYRVTPDRLWPLYEGTPQ